MPFYDSISQLLQEVEEEKESLNMPKTEITSPIPIPVPAVKPTNMLELFESVEDEKVTSNIKPVETKLNASAMQLIKDADEETYVQGISPASTISKIEAMKAAKGPEEIKQKGFIEDLDRTIPIALNNIWSAAASIPSVVGGLVYRWAEGQQETAGVIDPLDLETDYKTFNDFAEALYKNRDLQKALPPTVQLSAETSKYVVTKAKELIEANQKYVSKYAAPEDASAFNKLIGDLSHGAVSIAEALGLGLLFGPTVPALAFGGVAMSRAYINAREANVSPEKARNLSAINFATEAIGEYIGIEFLMSRLPYSKALSLILKGTSEGLQEMYQETSSNLIQKYGWDKTTKWNQNVLRSGVLGFLLGGTASVVIDSLIQGGNIPRDVAKPLINKVYQEMEKATKDITPERVNDILKKEQVGYGMTIKSKVPIITFGAGVSPFEQQPSVDLTQILRGTKGLTADAIMQKYPDIQLKRDVGVVDIYGKKRIIPGGMSLTPYELKGNKILLQDGETYIVSKGKSESIIKNATVAIGKEFAPELKGTIEVSKEEGVDVTKFKGYQEPGGEKYREILVQTPDTGKTGFVSPHWAQQDVLFHLRVNERTDVNGKKVLFVEEIQSDWAQKARQYEAQQKADKTLEDYKQSLLKKYDKTSMVGYTNWVSEEERSKIHSLIDLTVPIAKEVLTHPLLKNWQTLAVKRALQEAVNSNADYLSWTTGKQQADRYSLSQQVDSIMWRINEGGEKVVTIYPKGKIDILCYVDDKGTITHASSAGEEWIGKNLNTVIPKEISEKILHSNDGELKKEGLEIGGEWAKNLYDKQIPNIIKDVTGQNVENINMDIKRGLRDWREIKRYEDGGMMPIKEAGLKEGITLMTPSDDIVTITKVLKDGNFLAVSSVEYRGAKERHGRRPEVFQRYIEGISNTFNLRTPVATQQAIRITPEIIAKVKGLPPSITKPSGKQFEAKGTTMMHAGVSPFEEESDIGKGLLSSNVDKLIKQAEDLVGFYDYISKEIKNPKKFSKEAIKVFEDVSKNEVTSDFLKKIPNLKEIGVKELARPAWRVFQKIGIYDEIFAPSFAAEIRTSEDALEFTENIKHLKSLAGKNKEEVRVASKKIHQALEHPNLLPLLNPKERMAYEWGKKYYDAWADKLKIPASKRIDNYVTHIFEAEVMDAIRKKYPIDQGILNAFDYITPATIFNPYLQERLGKTTGLKEDFFASISAYEGRALKSFYYEPLIQRLRVYEKYLPPNAAKYLREFMGRVTSRPLLIDKQVNQTLKEIGSVVAKFPGGQKLATFLSQGNPAGVLSYNATGFLYESWMGFRPLSGIKNLAQQTLTLAETGPQAYLQALTLLNKKERARILNNSLVLKSRRSGYLPGIDESFIKQLQSKRRDVTMFMFKISEGINTSNAFLSGYFEAKNKGLPENVCFQRGDEVARKTQFLYTKFSASQFAQGAPGRVLSAFTTWAVNWAELMNDWVQGKPSEVYKQYEQTTGKKLTSENWIVKRKALWTYMTMVLLAGLVERETRIKAKDYIGWTSVKALAEIASGNVAGLQVPGAIMRLTAGLAIGDMKMAKTAWMEIRPDRFITITRELEDIMNGKKDWMNLFISLEKKKSPASKGFNVGFKTKFKTGF